MFEIREATADDADEVAAICAQMTEFLRQFYSPTDSAYASRAQSQAQRSRLVAVDAGQVVGTVECQRSGDALRVIGLAVHESRRRKGVARALVEHLAARSADTGCRALSISTVTATGNVPIFEALGFGVVSIGPAERSISRTGDPLGEATLERPTPLSGRRSGRPMATVAGGLLTASVYALVNGRIPFMAGPDRTGARVGVVRIGGHLLPHETPWECARREAFEETRLSVQAVDAPATYRVRPGEPPAPLVWAGGSPRPIHSTDHSQIYLAVSGDKPIPSSESRSLVLLTPDDVFMICDGEWTLGSFEDHGGQILLQDPADRDCLFSLPLDPRGPALLKAFLEIHPGLSLWESAPPLPPDWHSQR